MRSFEEWNMFLLHRHCSVCTMDPANTPHYDVQSSLKIRRETVERRKPLNAVTMMELQISKKKKKGIITSERWSLLATCPRATRKKRIQKQISS